MFIIQSAKHHEKEMKQSYTQHHGQTSEVIIREKQITKQHILKNAVLSHLY